MPGRAFRTEESLEAEMVTRRMVPQLFANLGFRNVEDDCRHFGTSVSQTVHAIAADGERVSARVKLGWRTRDGKIRYSASQLIAKIRTQNWEREIESFVNRARQEGVTHFLFVEREGDAISGAALVPAGDLLRIWCAQRDISSELIKAGKLGRRKKNHAMNGSSPTLWLADITAPAVTDILWKDPRVRTLLDLNSAVPFQFDDTYADLAGIDYSLIGSDGAARIETVRSSVKRDQRVRTIVLARAGGKCERCSESRPYAEFLDVHHILGAETSDRVWNCVAVCPNCHREAHFAPNGDEINRALLNWAIQFRGTTQTGHDLGAAQSATHRSSTRK